MGDALVDLGFDVDFAPVADLGPAAAGTGLETRCYGDDPATVTECCRAFLRGLSAAGVAGCLKHFPGLGGSAVDSHRDLPGVAGDLESRRPHLAPYAALAAEVPFVMTAHGRYDHLGDASPSSLCPATYSLLRETGFAGLSVTDDLNMGAVRGEGPLWARALRAFAAGADLALWAGPEEESLEACARLRGAAARLCLSPPGPMLGPGDGS
jgi:beta-N-acetylhexosaminidase